MYSDEEIRQLFLDFEGDYKINRNQINILAKLTDSRFLKFSLEILQSDDDTQISSALAALLHASHFHSSELLPQILPFLDIPSHCARAIKLLASIGNASVMPRLYAFLASPDMEVRKEAFFAIYRLGHPDIVEICLHLIHDTDIGMRMSACLGLGHLNNSVAVEPLIEKLKDNDFLDDWCVSAAAATALGEIQDRRATNPLIDCVRYGNEELSKAALGALHQIEDMSLEAFYIEQTFHIYRKTRETAIDILAVIGKADYTDVLISVSQNDPDYDVQCSAAKALEMIGTPEALTAYDHWNTHYKRKS